MPDSNKNLTNKILTNWIVDYDDLHYEDQMSVDWSYCENEDAWIDQALMYQLEIDTDID